MLYDQIAANKRNTVFLLIVFFGLLSLVGYGVGYLWLESGVLGLLLAVVIGCLYALFMIFQSTQVIMSLNRAKEVTADQAPLLYHTVEDMALVANIPMPRVFIIEDDALNAFATGAKPETAAVAATTGLLRALSREELEAVMGHEISHIRNYDIRLSTIAVALVSAIALLASFSRRLVWYGSGRRRSDDKSEGDGFQILILALSLLALVLAPLAATLVQLAISRQREYLADASSVELTRNPEGMISALQKLEQSSPMSYPIDDASAALYINNPMKNGGWQSLFQTHPPIADRIARLRQM